MIPESVAGAIFSADRESILLIERRDVPVWVLPGGGIEKNETAENAIIREILEETGFRVKIKRQVGEYLPINRLTRPTFLFECEIIDGEISSSSETKDARFFSLLLLPQKIPPPYREWIQEAHQAGPCITKYLTSVTYFTLFKTLLLHPLLVIRFILSRLGLHINT